MITGIPKFIVLAVIALCIMQFSLSSDAYEYYEEQSLEKVPVLSPNMAQGRTYNHKAGNRILAPKTKTYPFLDQLEYLLYPSMDFKKEHPGKRLERLEMSVFGAKQDGSIAIRLTKLQQEVDAWQIANMRPLDGLNSNTLQKEHLRETSAFAYQENKSTSNRRTLAPRGRQQPGYSNYPVQQSAYVNSYSSHFPKQRNQVDYDYQNYRMAAPLLQTIGRKGIQALFDN